MIYPTDRNPSIRLDGNQYAAINFTLNENAFYTNCLILLISSSSGNDLSVKKLDDPNYFGFDSVIALLIPPIT